MVGRVFPWEGSGDPTPTTCKLAVLYRSRAQKTCSADKTQKRVVVRSTVLHLLSSLAYKVVRVVVSAL